MKRFRVHQYGRVPAVHKQETAQFERVLQTIHECGHNLGEWLVVCIGVNYEHTAGERLANDFDWNGEYDLVLLAEHRIIVYELKSTVAKLLWGRSDDRPWKFGISNVGKVRRTSQFLQVSRQRAAFLQDFLENADIVGDGIASERHKVDHRLVIPDSADYSNFYFTLPQDLDDEELEEGVLPKIESSDDREFVREMYSIPFDRNGNPAKRRKPRPPKSDMQRLATIMPEEWHGKRISRWFRILKESEIEADLSAPGYRDFQLSETEAHTIAEAMLQTQ